ncbi:MAG: thiolase family protein, partial [Gammaproteobacteria bacterium]
MSNDVAIVGIGMHPFGRHEISGMEQGAIAVRTACADAGINWQDVQFAVGGSMAAGNPDRMVSMLGLTGLQFVNVTTGCATGGTALSTAYNMISAGVYDLGIAIGYDKHPRGAFASNEPVHPVDGGLDWYGGSG